MTSSQIRQKFLEFFKEKGHAIIPSASLIPSDTDPTVLFTTAGMQPLVPYFLGEKHPGGNRVANSQKCIRTVDIDEVGDASHLTFFEMLGNWSFGDSVSPDGIGVGYFKKEAIKWSWEFLTGSKWLGLDKSRLAVSVFTGDDDAPFDEEAFGLWKQQGVSEARIAKLGKKDNWWGPAGQAGPCGPDTEMFYWTDDSAPAPENFQSTKDDKRWVEIWNNVFMEYNKTADGKYEPLTQKNVDTGMGLERMSMVMQGKGNVYETDLFEPIIKKIKSLEELDRGVERENSERIIADHVKAAVFLIADGVEPSNVGRGYILRRLIRRAVRHGKIMEIKSNFLEDVADCVFNIYKDVPDISLDLNKNKEKIIAELSKEEEKFGKTLEQGLKEFEKISKNGAVSGKEAFLLFSTYGFPVEMTQELAKEKGVRVDMAEFDEETRKHQELSKTASAGMFKGGLSGAGEQTARLHTATHMLFAALRQVLGDHVLQKGSNITEERLRFDFSHPEKLSDEQKKKIEDLVNEKIKDNLPIVCQEMEIAKARESGAAGIFDSKYGEKVKVYTIGAQDEMAYSKEICGGPHASFTGELGAFRIKKEEAASAGVRRIKAVLE